MTRNAKHTKAAEQGPWFARRRALMGIGVLTCVTVLAVPASPAYAAPTVKVLKAKIVKLTKANKELRSDNSKARGDLSRTKKQLTTANGKVTGLTAELTAIKPSGPGGTRWNGTWRVGSELAAGTYRAGTGTGCYWERLSDFSGSFSSIITNEFGDAPMIVTVAGSDAGVKFSGECVWARVN